MGILEELKRKENIELLKKKEKSTEKLDEFFEKLKQFKEKKK